MKRVAAVTAIILVTLAVIAILWQLHAVALIFLLSLAISATLSGPIDWLTDHKWRRGIAIGTVYVGVFGFLLLLVGAAIYFVAQELDPLVQDLVVVYGNLQSTLLGLSSSRTAWIGRLPTTAQVVSWWAGGETLLAIQNVAGALTTLGSRVGELVLSIFLSIYWTADRNRFERLWFSLLAAEQRIRTRRLWRKLETDVGAYLRSEIIQTVLAILVFAAGYALLGVKYPYTMAVLAGVLWLVPLLGSVLALLAVLMIGVLSQPIVLAAAVVYTIVVLAVLEFYMQRRLYTQSRYWGVLLIVIMLAAADAFGFVGLLLAAPIALAIQIGINAFLNSSPQTAPPVQINELELMQKRLAEVRAKVEQDDAPADPRLASLVQRLEALIAEIQGEDIPIEQNMDTHETVLAGKLPMDLAENHV